MAKRIDVGKLEAIVGTLYPSPYDEPCRARERTRLGDVAGLKQFGVNLLRLPQTHRRSVKHHDVRHRQGSRHTPSGGRSHSLRGRQTELLDPITNLIPIQSE